MVGSIVLAALLATPTAAHGIQATLHSTATGVDSWNFDQGNTATQFFKAGVKVKDTAADNHAVYSTYTLRDLAVGRTEAEARRNNHGGYGSTATVGGYTNHKVVKHRGSVDIQLLPDRHGAWRYPS
ncbi:hypothetical protein LEP48_12765 [Isoptericola sp. NEAU-Y5]|uniref:Uncharacterized protein n=2 Tax=Isoptericola luteus TaxID=2879484 RepID=A0ABS7ZGQ1_9MICO|nr:hypothetical protein [Isoptericola sp. NEAU-Y5]